MIPYFSSMLSSCIGSFLNLKGVNLSITLSGVMVVLVNLRVLGLGIFWVGTTT
jgi:hypothetical protein